MLSRGARKPLAVMGVIGAQSKIVTDDIFEFGFFEGSPRP
jgi:hypothetical protein